MFLNKMPKGIDRLAVALKKRFGINSLYWDEKRGYYADSKKRLRQLRRFIRRHLEE